MPRFSSFSGANSFGRTVSRTLKLIQEYTIRSPDAYGVADNVDSYGGYALAINENYVSAGSFTDDIVLNGPVQVYNINDGTVYNPLLVEGYDTGPELISGSYGAYAVYQTGDYVLAGAPLSDLQGYGTNSGEVLIFNLDGTYIRSIGPSFNDQIVVADNQYFGAGMVGQGEKVLISAGGDGKASLFTINSTTVGSPPLVPDVVFLNPSTTPALFGFANDTMDIDGDIVIIGEESNDEVSTNNGKVHIYDATDTNSSTNLIRTLTCPDTAPDQLFGCSVAVNGNYALIGSQRSTAGTGSGVAYLYEVDTGNLLHTFTDPLDQDLSFFGSTVSMTTDLIFIGSPGTTEPDTSTSVGRVYVYSKLDFSLIKTLINPNDDPTSSSDQFGTRVESTDTHVAIGAPGEDNSANASDENEGRIYVFSINYT